MMTICLNAMLKYVHLYDILLYLFQVSLDSCLDCKNRNIEIGWIVVDDGLGLNFLSCRNKIYLTGYCLW